MSGRVPNRDIPHRIFEVRLVPITSVHVLITTANNAEMAKPPIKHVIPAQLPIALNNRTDMIEAIVSKANVNNVPDT